MSRWWPSFSFSSICYAFPFSFHVIRKWWGTWWLLWRRESRGGRGIRLCNVKTNHPWLLRLSDIFCFCTSLRTNLNSCLRWTLFIFCSPRWTAQPEATELQTGGLPEQATMNCVKETEADLLKIWGTAEDLPKIWGTAEGLLRIWGTERDRGRTVAGSTEVVAMIWSTSTSTMCLRYVYVYLNFDVNNILSVTNKFSSKLGQPIWKYISKQVRMH